MQGRYHFILYPMAVNIPASLGELRLGDEVLESGPLQVTVEEIDQVERKVRLNVPIQTGDSTANPPIEFAFIQTGKVIDVAKEIAARLQATVVFQAHGNLPRGDVTVTPNGDVTEDGKSYFPPQKAE